MSSASGHSDFHHGKDPHQTKLTKVLGMRWLFGAGTVAILFSVFLVSIDNYLTNSDREKRLNERMKEMRSAQTSLGSSSIDPRNHAPELPSGEQ